MSSTWEKNENFENSQIYLFHSYYYSAYLPVLKNVFIVEKYWFFEEEEEKKKKKKNRL